MLRDHGAILPADLMAAERVIIDLGRVRGEMVDISLDTTKEVRDRVGASRSAAGISKTALELSGHLKTNAAVQVNVGVTGAGSDELEQVYEILRERGEHALIEEIGARLSGVQLIEAVAVEPEG